MDDRSPLVIIAEKERECAERLASARLAAEHIVLEARRQAELLRKQAEQAGQAEASRLYSAGLAAADAQADEMRAEGERAAKRQLERGRASIGQAVTRILEIVLPETHHGNGE